MNIPIQNIYYMLVYAWNVLDEAETVDVHAEDCTKLLDLFASVLHCGAERIIRRGLDRGYIGHSESIVGIRGKVDFGASLKSAALPRGRAVCEFDDLSHNVLHNQILKSTMRRLLGSDELSGEIREKLAESYFRLHQIEECKITERTFRGIQLHRNNRQYRLLMDVCRLIHRACLAHERPGESEFRDFFREPGRMRVLFERFVRNFYRRENEEAEASFRVIANSIRWAGLRADPKSKARVPGMRTDIQLRFPDRLLVIETKFVPKMFQFNPKSGRETIRSNHLYQLFAYITNLALTMPEIALEGVLLYPVSCDGQQDVQFILAERPYRAAAINLNQNWMLIKRDLLALTQSSRERIEG